MGHPSNYILGHSEFERERLIMQARILRPYTESYFRSAGIVPGMSVLDIGSGAGDVALLAADIVGTGGRVWGLDRDPEALEKARRRAVEQGCSGWVEFSRTDINQFETTEMFDAIVGRYVLMYQTDPGSTLRHLTRFLRPGGIVAMHEMDMIGTPLSYPPCLVYDELNRLVQEALRRVGLPPDFGRRLGVAFLDAGLPFPTMRAETSVEGGAGAAIYPWMANTVISVAGRLEQLGLQLPEGVVADQTLAARIEEAALATGSQLIGPTQFGAWTRKVA